MANKKKAKKFKNERMRIPKSELDAMKKRLGDDYNCIVQRHVDGDVTIEYKKWEKEEP